MKRIERLYRTAVLLTLLTLAAACTRDDGFDDMSPGTPPPSTTLTVTVTDGGYSYLPEADATDAAPDGTPATRAVENGYATVFTKGDRIGLYVSEVEVDAGGTPTAFKRMVHKNLCLTYDGTKWEPPAGIKLKYNPIDGLEIRYYAYYPYQADIGENSKPDGTNLYGSIANTDTEFFWKLINDWHPKNNQDTYAAYTASDLMTARGVVSNGTVGSTLSFAMQHRMILCIVRLPHTTCNYQEIIGGTSFDKSYSLYSGDSFRSLWKENHYTARYILKPEYSLNFGGSFYNSDFEKKQYSGSIRPDPSLSGKYILFTVDGGKEEVKDRPLKEGDFYMKDGTVLPQEAFSDGANIPDEVKKDCIGVVFWVGEKEGIHWTQTEYKRGDYLLMDKHSACTHGMVVALQNASDSPVAWATNPLDGQSLWDWAYDFNGFTDNEKSLWKMIYESNPNYGYAYNALFGLYTALNQDTDFPAYEAVKTYAGIHSTPEGCSGWFFPCRYELATIWFDAPDNFSGKPIVFDKINLQIKKAGGTELKGSYWSSDDDSSKRAWAALSDSYGVESQTEKYNVRAVLAF